MTGKRKKEISVRRVVLTSFIVDILDVVVNGVAAFISGSVVMLSQALQGISDLIAAFFLVLGVKGSRRAPDKKYPFGYGRELYLWTFLSALVTFSITSAVSFYLGLKRFLNPEVLENIGYAYLALTIALITNGYSMSLSTRRLLGKKLITKIRRVFSKSVFIATKKALVLDLMGTIASALGLLALVLYEITGVLRFDGLGSMVIGVSMGILAFYIIKESKNLIIGQGASLGT